MGEVSEGTVVFPGLESEVIERRAVAAVARLFSREVAVRLLALLGGVVLARALTPGSFGLFVIAYFVLNLFATFSELGLGAAFIRVPGPISRGAIDALFSFQFIVAALLATAIAAAAQVIAGWYHAPEATTLMRVLAGALLLMSVRTAPTVLAERRLSYGPVALSDVLRHATFWAISITLALLGFGAASLVAAVLVSTLVGAIAICVGVGWFPRFHFDWRSIRPYLRFGLIYQGQAVSHVVKDSMIPSVGGVLFGPVAVGYLTWAHQLALVPLILTGLVTRVSYPALSQLQEDRRAFMNMLRSTLAWTSRLSFPAFGVLAGLAPAIVDYVYGSKWLPALPSLYALIANMLLGVATGVLLPALYSAGRPAAGLRISVTWGLVTLALALGLSFAGFGYISLAYAYLLGTAFALILILISISSLGKLGLLRAVWWPSISGLAVTASLFSLSPRTVHGLVSLGVAAVCGLTVGLAANVWPHRHTAIGAMLSGWTAERSVAEPVAVRGTRA